MYFRLKKKVRGYSITKGQSIYIDFSHPAWYACGIYKYLENNLFWFYIFMLYLVSETCFLDKSTLLDMLDKFTQSKAESVFRLQFCF